MLSKSRPPAMLRSPRWRASFPPSRLVALRLLGGNPSAASFHADAGCPIVVTGQALHPSHRGAPLFGPTRAWPADNPGPATTPAGSGPRQTLRTPARAAPHPNPHEAEAQQALAEANVRELEPRPGYGRSPAVSQPQAAGQLRRSEERRVGKGGRSRRRPSVHYEDEMSTLCV